MSAHPYKEGALYASLKDLNWSALADICVAQHNRNLIIKSSSSSTEKGNYVIDVAENEVEESELIFSKKHIDSNNHAAAIVFPEALACFSNQRKKTLPIAQYLSYISPYRYLVFQMFRI